MISEDLNYIENTRQMAIARISQLLEPGEENDKAVKQLEEYFLDKLKPTVFRLIGGTNIVVDTEKKFEKLCTSMAEAGISNARELNMFDFRIKMEYFEDKAEKQKKHADQ